MRTFKLLEHEKPEPANLVLIQTHHIQHKSKTAAAVADSDATVVWEVTAKQAKADVAPIPAQPENH